MTAMTLDMLDAGRLAQTQSADAGVPWQVYRDAEQLALVAEPDLPVLCFSPEQLKRSVQAFLDGFPGCVAYAVKANSSHDVLDCVARAGVRVFDVASTSEMAQVAAASGDYTLHYHNPVKSRREIAAAFNTYGCRRYAADTVAEIDKIAEVTGATRGVEIAIRFRLRAIGHSAHDFSTKFGVNPNEAVKLLQHAAGLGFDCVLTFHPGSQCVDANAWRRHITAAADIARTAGVPVTRLNVGGGFPARYGAAPIPELAMLFKIIETTTRETFAGLAMPELECEPGRAIVAPCQSVLTRVKLVRRERRELFLNDGIYGALMEVSQVRELMPPHRAIRRNGSFAAATTDWIVFGPTCDPLDTLPVKLRLPCDIAEDDYVEFGTIGAYGAATATGFNGYGKYQRAWVQSALTV